MIFRTIKVPNAPTGIGVCWPQQLYKDFAAAFESAEVAELELSAIDNALDAYADDANFVYQLACGGLAVLRIQRSPINIEILQAVILPAWAIEAIAA